ncbi:MAG: hypothetical protein EB127_16880 [Alphaproteobacteria bacterium]|nr:hypothetical protein [Alphaproteobacteria bacterium]
MKGLVVCMRAVPGSGKSTFAKKMEKKFKSEGKSAVIVSADKFFERLGGGEYKFDPKKLPQAHKECFDEFINALENNTDLVIVDNTNLAPWESAKYKEAADKYGYDFVVKQIEADISEAAKRNVHGVPEDRYPAMAEKMKQSLPKDWKHDRYRTEAVDGDVKFIPIENEIKKARQKYRMSKFSSIINS